MGDDVFSQPAVKRLRHSTRKRTRTDGDQNVHNEVTVDVHSHRTLASGSREQPALTENNVNSPGMSIIEERIGLIRTRDDAIEFVRQFHGQMIYQKCYECFIKVLPAQRYARFIDRLLNDYPLLAPEDLIAHSEETVSILIKCSLAENSQGVLKCIEALKSDLREEQTRHACASELADRILALDTFINIAPDDCRTRSTLFDFLMRTLMKLPAALADELLRWPVDKVISAISSADHKEFMAEILYRLNPAVLIQAEMKSLGSLFKEPFIYFEGDYLNINENVICYVNRWNAFRKNVLVDSSYTKLSDSLKKKKPGKYCLFSKMDLTKFELEEQRILYAYSSAGIAELYNKYKDLNELTMARLIYQSVLMPSVSRLDKNVLHYYDQMYDFFAPARCKDDGQFYKVSLKPDISFRYKSEAMKSPLLIFFGEEKVEDRMQGSNFSKSVFMAALMWKHFQFLSSVTDESQEVEIPIIPFVCCHGKDFEIYGLSYNVEQKHFETSLLFADTFSTEEGVDNILYAIHSLCSYIESSFIHYGQNIPPEFEEMGIILPRIGTTKPKTKKNNGNASRPPSTEEDNSSSNMREIVNALVVRLCLKLVENYPSTPKHSNKSAGIELIPLIPNRGIYKDECHVVPCRMLETGRNAFLKVSLDKDRMQHEYDIINRLSGKNCTAKAYAFEIHDNYAYMLTEDVGWPAFRARTLVEWTCFAKNLLECVAKIHEAGLVHADLSPGNVCYHRFSERYIQVRVIDFEFASEIDHYTGKTKKLYGAHGTAGFVAPEDEKFEGKKRVALTIQSDLYSVGKILENAAQNIISVVDDSAHAALLRSLTAEDPSKRPLSARDALKSLDSPHSLRNDSDEMSVTCYESTENGNDFDNNGKILKNVQPQ